MISPTPSVSHSGVRRKPLYPRPSYSFPAVGLFGRPRRSCKKAADWSVDKDQCGLGRPLKRSISTRMAPPRWLRVKVEARHSLHPHAGGGVEIPAEFRVGLAGTQFRADDHLSVVVGILR